jgi:quercetin dioxygenase-like cupin family protein
MSSLNDEIAKSRVYTIVKLTEYVPHTIVSKTIIKRSTGNITVMSFDTGEEFAEKISPFDTFAQVIDGSAEVTINKKVHLLQSGEGMIIPAHTPNRIRAHQRCKVLLTTIKSGYKE